MLNRDVLKPSVLRHYAMSILAGFAENIHLEELDMHENGILRIENIAHLSRLSTLGTATSPVITRIRSLHPRPLTYVTELGNNAISSLRSGLKSLTRLRQVTKFSSHNDTYFSQDQFTETFASASIAVQHSLFVFCARSDPLFCSCVVL